MAEFLYRESDPSNEAYLLREGDMEYHITPQDKIVISGKNIIVGAGELLIAMNRKEVIPRHMSLVAVPGCQYNRIPGEKLASFIQNYAIGFSVAHHIATTITKLHPLLYSKLDRLHESDRLIRELTVALVEMVQYFEEESRNQQFPWLFSLIEKGKRTEAYNQGLSYVTAGDDKKIDISAENLQEYKENYPKGSIICREGQSADDMFILMKGKIQVLIKGNPIDIISRSGTVIGEMGLILGQPRTATLKALEDVHVVKISSADMENIFREDPKTFFGMISSLAFRERDNCMKIREYAKLVQGGSIQRDISVVNGFAAELVQYFHDLELVCEQQLSINWLSNIKIMIEQKLNALLNRVTALTGRQFSVNEEGGRVSAVNLPPPGPVRKPAGDQVPEIDWF